jgi:hypothetical protein
LDVSPVFQHVSRGSLQWNTNTFLALLRGTCRRSVPLAWLASRRIQSNGARGPRLGGGLKSRFQRRQALGTPPRRGGPEPMAASSGLLLGVPADHDVLEMNPRSARTVSDGDGHEIGEYRPMGTLLKTCITGATRREGPSQEAVRSPRQRPRGS